jgi:hypothetical protein
MSSVATGGANRANAFDGFESAHEFAEQGSGYHARKMSADAEVLATYGPVSH